jgi:predicted  nucleic acid-binding Zn-ribbon protein
MAAEFIEVTGTVLLQVHCRGILGTVADDLYQTLMRFHREIAVPDMERIVEARATPIQDQAQRNFDALWKRFGDLDQEYQAIKAALGRLEAHVETIEQRLGAVDAKLDKLAMRSEVEELRAEIARLEQRVAALEAQL